MINRNLKSDTFTEHYVETLTLIDAKRTITLYDSYIISYNHIEFDIRQSPKKGGVCVYLLTLLLILIGIILGVVVGYIIARNLLHQKQIQAKQTAEDIINQANKEAENIKKEKLLEAKEENQIFKDQVESELRERCGDLQKQETRLLQKEENLERKSDLLEKKDEILEQKESELEEKQQQVDAKRVVFKH